LKSIFISLLLFFTITPAVFSQNQEFIAGAFIGFYGIEIKGDIQKMYSNTFGDVTGTGGMSAGFNVKHNFSKNNYLAFELRWIRKGSIYGFTTSYGTQGFESIKLDYIEMPILIGQKINLKNKYLLTETGFAYAKKMYSRMEINQLNKWDYTYKLNKFRQNDISWVVNIKYPVIKSGRLLIGFRFSYSIFSIHSLYKLYNMDYGAEIYYLFNRNIQS
jgi:hypothetical protein